ncbi:hypothetical protein AURDEDRAFT_138670 [Auricularia subglabra TFB-10046 SS5]|uniref:Uncharacterized protein n=1 Tax=Auricularia subglabra (strain TFB-10046 / SS5) TaxID=717982 RepID=J0WYV2_AURST|nr:hypothetical protein AURDEDRAFT_138670 [Auricularia subglabra TFB-10046 SS5]
MRALIVAALQRWRKKIWLALPWDSTSHIPPWQLISDPQLTVIAAKIYELGTVEQVRTLLDGFDCPMLRGHEASLFEALKAAREDADKLKAEKQEAALVKRRATIAANREAAAAGGSDSESDEEPDSETGISVRVDERREKVFLRIPPSLQGQHEVQDKPENAVAPPLQDTTNTPAARAIQPQALRKRASTKSDENAAPQKRTRRG